ncbi:MAG TPA: small basic family protein [Fimbriimonas sp.]
MILIPIIAVVIGAALALAMNVQPIPGLGGQYLAVACLAGLDTICGGIRSGLEGKFRNDVFFSGFLSNVLIALLLVWFGDQIFINLYIAIALILGARIFTNLSLIRRYVLTRIQDARERAKLQRTMVVQPTAQPEINP